MPLIRKPDQGAAKPQTTAADVLTALTNGNQQERWSAARAAADIPGGLNALIAALNVEADSRVREAMFTSLTRIGSPEAVTALIAFLRADDAGLRTSALDALRALRGAVRTYLPALMSDSDSDVRILSCELVRELPGEEATTALCALLAQESEANVCAAAIEVLTEVGNPNALPALDACAARFPATPFLTFAIRIARERILSQSLDSHA